jgi:predicted MFS family arabinose efflux permease
MGNALATAIVRVGSLTGPLLGGLLVAPAGPSPAFAVDAATFGVSAAAMALIRVKRRPPADTGTLSAPPATRQAVLARGSDPPVPPAVPADILLGRAGRGVAPTTWQLLRQSRVLRIILAVTVTANLAAGGTFEVAMPALAHARYGASGYGALIASFGAGVVAGTLAGSRMGLLHRPIMAACAGFVVEAAALCLLPLSSGLVGALIALMVAGVCNGFGNVVLFTLIQQQFPAQSLGRVMSLLMVSGIGSFPVSVGIAGLLVRHLHAAAFFPVAGIALGGAVLAALTRKEMREFGTAGWRDPAAGPDQAG